MSEEHLKLYISACSPTLAKAMAQTDSWKGLSLPDERAVHLSDETFSLSALLAAAAEAYNDGVSAVASEGGRKAELSTTDVSGELLLKFGDTILYAPEFLLASPSRDARLAGLGRVDEVDSQIS